MHRLDFAMARLAQMALEPDNPFALQGDNIRLGLDSGGGLEGESPV
jgi:hypothetical protein